MESKIVEFSPNIIDNVHKTWLGGENKSKTFWEFNMTMEDGKKGIASSSLEHPKWEIGVLYTYDYKEPNNYPARISGLKKVSFIKPKSDYNNPKDTKEIAMSVCQSAVVDIYKLLKEQSIEFDIKEKNNCTLVLYNWIIAEGVEKRAKVSIRWNAIIRAVNELNFFTNLQLSNILETQKHLGILVSERLAANDMKFLKEHTND